ncbi:ATP-binding protein [Halomonas getboli]|uniref:ATP-binding protein n=1 Tax=Halomonas getboli TaxID=2935862 RepID=UPI002000281A|nr:ATP-binding protein [Halomonas getboli]MCK2185177.1 ATP-binding protein [Halomonas getboli]
MSSIRRRTLGLVLAVVALCMLAIGVTSYRDAAHEVEALFDARLAQHARLLEGLVHAPLPEARRDALLASLDGALRRDAPGLSPDDGHRYEGKVAFQAWRGDRLLLRSAGAPAEPFTDRRAGYGDETLDGHEWRVFALGGDGDLRVLVGERGDVRGELVTGIALRTLVPDLLGLPALAALLWWAIGWGLRPLSRLATQIEARDPQRLNPLPDDPLPRELATIVGALNGLLARIRRLRSREKRFIADAAHELRTPLTVLDLHAQNALAAEDPEDRREALTLLRDGLARTTRVVGQLLTLARLDPEQESAPDQRIDLLHEVRESLAELMPLATDHRQSLHLEADDGADWRLRTEPGAVATLMQNLVGNAIRHSPAGSRIDVALSAEAQALRLQVDDSGPGIPEAHRQQALARFHRGGSGAGAGLGLSIVDRLVQRHGGRLTLDDAPGGGLRVQVWLPRP